MPHEKFLWPICRKVEQSSSLTECMIERLDVDKLALVRQDKGAVFAEIQRACFECPRGDQCWQWLTADDPSQPEPEFCPNLRRFAEYRRASALPEQTPAPQSRSSNQKSPTGRPRQKDC